MVSQTMWCEKCDCEAEVFGHFEDGFLVVDDPSGHDEGYLEPWC